jgi:hypothetical protein
MVIRTRARERVPRVPKPEHREGSCHEPNGLNTPQRLLATGSQAVFISRDAPVPLIGLSYSRFEVDTRAPADRDQFGDLEKSAGGSIRL